MADQVFKTKKPLLLEGKQPKTAVVPTGKVGSGEKKSRKGFGEMAGGTTAECAAVCCCCPCTVMNLLILAVYRVPACLCRKARRRRRLRRMKKQPLLAPTHSGGSHDELVMEITDVVESAEGGAAHGDDQDADVVNLEKEMWDRFYRTGFFRSPSERHED
ncbi:hypothetical protein K2173_013766 [Erythroxylum novogranatense]|uniref:Uncharacterized protein n=1 Tax=Erythroxylum novogranatense TaxID=1862640 RepID=A0AAV8SCV8_9ROSI|nr:hypothetical protein K2173_013766 [Erythroxylum novogranatense]